MVWKFINLAEINRGFTYLKLVLADELEVKTKGCFTAINILTKNRNTKSLLFAKS